MWNSRGWRVVYCPDCEQVRRETPALREGGAGADRFGQLQCQRCGALLPAHASAAALLAKLKQLARFGLTERGAVARPSRGSQ
jgi:hypothetical protein